MRGLLRCGLITALLFSNLGGAQDGDHGPSNSTVADGSTTSQTNVNSLSSTLKATSTLGNGTCPSRTANYITHTLPQQCLRTDRVSPTANGNKTTDGQKASSGSLTESSVVSSTVASLSSEFSSSSDHAQPSPSTASEGGTDSPTSSESSPSGSASSPGPEAETDSPLDNANFLSFEEWKKQNVAKIERDQARNLPVGGDRQRPGINNALDSLGEEGEIELDFSGFGSAASGPRQQQAAYRSSEGTASEQSVPASQNVRSKDAGKTCKERTNYASFDCAATILKNNPECKSASSVLVENKDSYMLNTCSAQNKFFIVELCNDILIDTVVLANYEFFSSIFRHFRVSVSDRYPVKMDKWRDLGTFQGRNTREVQAFLIEHPQIWARYLRIEFLTHYGSEYYCPISLLRVHGTTMLEDLRPHEEVAHGEGEDDEVTLEAEFTASPAISVEQRASSDVQEKDTLHTTQSVDTTSSQEAVNAPGSTIATIGSTAEDYNTKPGASNSNSNAPNATSTYSDVLVGAAAKMTCSPNSTSLSDALIGGANETSHLSKLDVSSNLDESESSILSTRSESNPAPPSATNGSSSSAKLSSNTTNTNDTQLPHRGATNATTNSTLQGTPVASQAANLNSTSNTLDSTQAESKTNTTRTFSTPSATSLSAQPQPSTQESFFKSISKRLAQLESNSTLSLQYIEEQSRILRDAFSKVEKRQITSTSNFLTNLNETVMQELHGFRQAYDQLWQSTVLELEGQRDQYQREMLALSTRLGMVADELVWQKRMGIVQSTLLLLCLGLVLFARTGTQGYLEVPLMQQMMNKSSAALSRAGWESPPGSPSPEGRSPVSLFRRKLWRSATEPGSVGGNVTDSPVTDSRPETRDGPDVSIQPPTPPSDIVLKQRSNEGPQPNFGDDADDEEDILDPRKLQSGPSTPTGTRERVDTVADTSTHDPDTFDIEL